MTPYEKTVTVTTTTSPQIVAVDYPGRCVISRVAVVRVGTGAIVADFFNRAFTSAAKAIASVTDDGNGKTQIQLTLPFGLAEGDVVAVAGTAVAGYNTTHRVTKRVDDKNYVTDQTYTVAAGQGGTLTLAIPAAEQPLYKALDELTGTDNAEATPEAVYVNQDPLPNLNIGVVRKIYVKLATAATYRISIRSYENVGW